MSGLAKTYRVFISSTARLLQEEREYVSREILKNGMFPIQMEYSFTGTNTERSIEIDKKKIEEADAVVFILSFLYGEVIGAKIGEVANCPMNDPAAHICTGKNGRCKANDCSLSFTEFEYEYASKLEKPIFILWNKEYNNDSALEALAARLNDGSLRPDYYSGKTQNFKFVEPIRKNHCYPYKDSDPADLEDSFKSKAREIAIDIKARLIELDDDKTGAFGLVSYKLLQEAIQECEELKCRLSQSVEKVYKSQAEAISDLAEESKNKDIFLDEDNQVAPVKVLAIRGLSFTGNGMGHDEWSQFTLPDNFYGQFGNRNIETEFILADSNNEELIKYRYSAFSNNAPSPDVYMERYKRDMESVHERIRAVQQRGKICKLYYHNEKRLPFRLIFIGRYVFLSTFSKEYKATEAPVLRIPCTSSLYTVCKEYYNWIKQEAREAIFD